MIPKYIHSKKTKKCYKHNTVELIAGSITEKACEKSYCCFTFKNHCLRLGFSKNWGKKNINTYTSSVKPSPLKNPNIQNVSFKRLLYK